MNPAFNMIERKEPTFVKLAEGEVIQGVLLRMERIEMGSEKKKVVRYTVHEFDSGHLCSFLGAYQIDSKLTMADIGHVISVRCEGEDRNVRRNGNAMKLYTVLVSEKKFAENGNTPVVDSSIITDDDIPF
jgi:hypothetical protein